MLNVGETHYPYALPHEDPKDWPRISGVHGVFKHMGDPDADAPEQFFDQEQLDALRQRQIDAVTYLDEDVFPRLFDKLPADTWLVVTADHGELFGEEGYFGHGPIQHPKVTEVPFVEGLAPRVAAALQARRTEAGRLRSLRSIVAATPRFGSANLRRAGAGSAALASQGVSRSRLNSISTTWSPSKRNTAAASCSISTPSRFVTPRSRVSTTTRSPRSTMSSV